MHELYFGAYNSQRTRQNLEVVDRLQFQVLELSLEDARAAGRVRAQMKAAGTPIGPFDVLIAGQALARDLVLVTGNVAEFSRIPELRWEDWSGTPAQPVDGLSALQEGDGFLGGGRG